MECQPLVFASVVAGAEPDAFALEIIREGFYHFNRTGRWVHPAVGVLEERVVVAEGDLVCLLVYGESTAGGSAFLAAGVVLRAAKAVETDPGIGYGCFPTGVPAPVARRGS